MSKIIWVIIIVLIVVIGGYFLFKGVYQTSTRKSIPIPAEKESIPPANQLEEAVSEPKVKEFIISGTEYSFSPSSITVSTGDKVKITLRNDGRIKHNLIIQGLEISSRSIGPGQTDIVEFIAPASGTYSIYCSFPGHRARGMEGILKVE